MTYQRWRSHLVDPAPDDLHAARLWRQIEARLDQHRLTRPRRLPMWLAGAALGCSAMASLWLTVGVHVPASVNVESTPTQVSEVSKNTIDLPDGSKIFAAANSSVRIAAASANAVDAVLETGAARFEVAANPGRLFRVFAAHLEVRVMASRFRLELGATTPTSVDVAVDEGSIVVATPGGQTFALTAGEHWGTVEENPRRQRIDAVAAHADAPPLNHAPTPAQAKRPNTVTSHPRPSPADALFEVADTAWVQGRTAAALEAFETLRRRFPNHGASALAALQIGRIRLDALGDAAGALRAFEEARALAPNASFRDVLDARMVDALSKLGDKAKCERARDEFLARHPHSPQAAAVRSRCR